MKKNIKFIMGDRKSVSVHFFAGKNLIYGLENLVESYYIKLNDILVFTYASDSTFVVSCFKSCGIEYHHNSKELTTVIEGEPQGTIMVSDSSDGSKILIFSISYGTEMIYKFCNLFLFSVLGDNNLFLDHGPEEGNNLYALTNLFSVFWCLTVSIIQLSFYSSGNDNGSSR